MHKFLCFHATVCEQAIQGQNEPGVANFHANPEKGQIWMKRVVGIGLGLYLGSAFLRSPEFKMARETFKKWRKPLPLKNARNELNCVGSGGDSPPNELVPSPSLSTIFTLPREMRLMVWDYLKSNELKNVRLVCKQLLDEVDNGVGIFISLDCYDMEQINWVRGKTIQGCTVINYQSPYDWIQLFNTCFLKELNIEDLITIDGLVEIVQTFPSLRDLSFSLTNDTEQNEWEFNARVFETLKVWFPWISLMFIGHIEDSESDWRWVMSMRCRNRYELSSYITPHAKYPTPKFVALMIPPYDEESTFENKEFWKEFLDAQKNVKFVSCDIGLGAWSGYLKFIKENIATLETLNIHNITNFNQDDNSPMCLDWNILKGADKLEQIGFEGLADHFTDGPIIYKQFEYGTFKCLTRIHFDLGRVHWTLYSSIIHASSENLKQLALFQLDTVDPVSRMNSPFDWAVLENCHNLEILKIYGVYSGFIGHENFGFIPRNISFLEIGWFAFKKGDLNFLAKNLTKFVPHKRFLELCDVTGLHEGTSAADYVINLRHQKDFFSVGNLVEMYQSLPIPIIYILQTAWLLWV